jgi:hypothetical protein
MRAEPPTQNAAAERTSDSAEKMNIKIKSLPEFILFISIDLFPLLYL